MFIVVLFLLAVLVASCAIPNADMPPPDVIEEPIQVVNKQAVKEIEEIDKPVESTEEKKERAPMPRPRRRKLAD
jgi:hypothetical protein